MAQRQPGQQTIIFLLFGVVLSLVAPTISIAAVNKHQGDTHYTEAGFFDIHICNWPKRPLFFLALFSTTQFNEIKKIELYDNNNRYLDDLDLSKYRLVMLEKPRREKRVFLKQIEIPKTSGNGWYSTKVHMKNGKTVIGRDYVIIHKMERASGIQPKDKSNLTSIPKTFSWNPIPGAKYYQVFINDAWEGKSVYSSQLLDEPKLEIPKNLLQTGGAYCWRIHARDVNENILLGDFNHGSLTQCFDFEISE